MKILVKNLKVGDQFKYNDEISVVVDVKPRQYKKRKVISITWKCLNKNGDIVLNDCLITYRPYHELVFE